MRDARILLLDEPTSALDAQAEFELFARLRSLARGRTAIYISHRFSTVRQADRILFLEHGRLVEEGTHDELMALGGRYAQLFTLQAAAYTGEPMTRPRRRPPRRRAGHVSRACAGRRVGAVGRRGGRVRRGLPLGRPVLAGVGRRLAARTERRLCRRRDPRPYEAAGRAATSTPALEVVDLHARLAAVGPRPADRGANAATSTSRGCSRATSRSRCFAVATKSPRHLNIERNDDRSDDITLVALAQRLAAGDLAQPAGAGRAPWRPSRRRSRRASEGRLTIRPHRADLATFRAEPRRADGAASTAGLLAIEGAHALDDDPANVDVAFDAPASG